MKTILAHLCLMTLVLTGAISDAETLALQAEKDTYIDSIKPDQNFGQNWKLLITGSPYSHGLLHFDFSALPATAEIDMVKLTMMVHFNSNVQLYAFHSLTSFWEEDAATWIRATNHEDWNSAGGDYQASSFIALPLPGLFPGWVVADITSHVRDEQGQLDSNILENGIIIKADRQYSKILSSEFAVFANAESCHSCHGAYPLELDEGKSTTCAECHSQGSIPLHGEPTLLIEYHIPDTDGDGIADALDNCPGDPNSDQKDNDLDGSGDVCDSDDDNDSIEDGSDNCQFVPNTGQEDYYPQTGNNCGNACECEGDFDSDHDVDGTDAAAFKSDFGRSTWERPCTAVDTCSGDFMCDSGVDGSDAAVFKSDFGRSAYSNACSSCVTVPWCIYS